MADITIREASEPELNECAAVIRAGFATVAEEFHLTRKNCPNHAAFITTEVLREMVSERGFRPFALFADGRMAGFVALRDEGEGVFWIGKLAVLPEFRHHGFGRMLMDFVQSEARQSGAVKVTLALIEEHAVLKRWYEAQGFIQTRIEHYEHLPFTVCFMEKELPHA